MANQLASQLRLRASPPTVPPGLVRRRKVEALLSSRRRAAGDSGQRRTRLGQNPLGGVLVGSAKVTGAAWLTVDETDNDLATFWADVLGALTVAAVLPADSALRDLVPAAGFGPTQALQVRAGLAELPGPVVLVLDDFQEVTGTAVLGFAEPADRPAAAASPVGADQPL